MRLRFTTPWRTTRREQWFGGNGAAAGWLIRSTLDQRPGPGTFLTPDRGDRDWANRRFILPVPRDAVQTGPSVSAHYEGRLDYAGCDVIAGWVWNASAPDGPIGVRILSDGNPLTTLTANRPRPDLKDAGKGSGAHAFVLDVPATLKDGRRHSIVAKTEDSVFELPNSPQHVTCR